MAKTQAGKEMPLTFECFRLQNAFGGVPLTEIDLQSPKQASDTPTSYPL